MSPAPSSRCYDLADKLIALNAKELVWMIGFLQHRLGGDEEGGVREPRRPIHPLDEAGAEAEIEEHSS